MSFTGVSKGPQLMLDQVEAAISLWDRWTRWRRTRQLPGAESVAARFISVFEAHGIHRNQIPRFFGHGLTLEDVQRDECLLPKLTETILDAVCAKFAVRREWLDGADDHVRPVHHFYKRPEGFADFLEALRIENPDAEFGGVVIAPSDCRCNSMALLVLDELIGWVGDKPIYRYHLCDEWVFSYWKARAYLAACVAIAWRRKVYLEGVKAKSKEIVRLTDGRALIGERHELRSVGEGRWYPEDMALKPMQFLEGIDPEINGYGLQAGLALWLELHQEGFMETGLPMYNAKAVRSSFECMKDSLISKNQ